MKNTYEEIEKANEELWNEYLFLAEKFQNRMPVYEFGVCMIKFASRMLYDCAPSEKTAHKTIAAAIEMGYEDSHLQNEID